MWFVITAPVCAISAARSISGEQEFKSYSHVVLLLRTRTKMATQKATTESPSKSPLVKSVAVPKIAKCTRKEETLEAKRPAPRKTKPLIRVLLPIAPNPLQVK